MKSKLGFTNLHHKLFPRNETFLRAGIKTENGNKIWELALKRHKPNIKNLQTKGL